MSSFAPAPSPQVHVSHVRPAVPSISVPHSTQTRPTDAPRRIKWSIPSTGLAGPHNSTVVSGDTSVGGLPGSTSGGVLRLKLIDHSSVQTTMPPPGNWFNMPPSLTNNLAQIRSFETNHPIRIAFLPTSSEVLTNYFEVHIDERTKFFLNIRLCVFLRESQGE